MLGLHDDTIVSGSGIKSLIQPRQVACSLAKLYIQAARIGLVRFNGDLILHNQILDSRFKFGNMV